MKGPTPEQHDGTGLRIGIVHARWNAEIIDPLLEGTKAKLLACGVPEANIVVESVPGSWELPIGVQRYDTHTHTCPSRLPLRTPCSHTLLLYLPVRLLPFPSPSPSRPFFKTPPSSQSPPSPKTQTLIPSTSPQS